MDVPLHAAKDDKRARWPNRAQVVIGFALLVGVCVIWLWPNSGNTLRDQLSTQDASVVSLSESEEMGSSHVASMAASEEMESLHVASKVNHFGLSLLAAVYNATGRGNVFISPISIAEAIGLASLGATPGGRAQHELLNSLEVNASDAQSFYSGQYDLNAEISSGHGVQFLNANSIWLSCSIKFEYVRKAEAFFGAEVRKLPSTPDPINEWCSEHTHGMVPSILNSINSNDVAVLLNAVYFKGTWTHQFSHSYPEHFFASVHGVARKVPCTMMHLEEHMKYANTRGVQVVELPYGDGRFVATVLMPKAVPSRWYERRTRYMRYRNPGWRPRPRTHTTINDLLDPQGNPLDLEMDWSRMRRKKIHLSLPRFKLDFGVHDMVPQLESALGIYEPFDSSIPGMFNNMSSEPNVYMSRVLHKAVVEVNEEGTTAAAATASRFAMRSFSFRQVHVKIDHPFVFLIRDSWSGLLLFSGVVENPELNA